MIENADCAIKFSAEIAYTILYTDSEGRLLFVFEPGDSPKTISLHRTPLDAQTNQRVAFSDSNRSRLTRSFDSVSAFLQSRGYQVSPYGDEP